MSARTLIQWCDSTVNPTMGCNGCELWNPKEKTCYAGTLTERFGGMNRAFPREFLKPELFPGRMREAANWSDLTGRDRNEKPWLNGLPRIIFISDMGDALSVVPGSEIPFEYLATEIINNVSGFSGCRHVWIWLTKRPGRMLHPRLQLGQGCVGRSARHRDRVVQVCAGQAKKLTAASWSKFT